MKTKIRALILTLAGIATIGIAIKAKANVVTFYGPLVNEAVTFNRTFVFDLNKNNVHSMSVQATMSTTSIAAATFNDGAQSTGNIIISSWTALNPSRAQATITITSNSATDGSYATDLINIASNSVLAGATAFNTITVSSNVNISSPSFTFNGTVYASSNAWSLGASSIATAGNLTRFINTIFGVVATTANSNGNVITLYAPRPGTFYNQAYTLTSSTQFLLTVAFSSFAGGADPVVLTVNNQDPINKQRITAGIQYQVGVSSMATALNLAIAIRGLQFGLIASTSIGSVGSTVTVNSISSGAVFNSYTLTSSSPSALTVFTTNFFGGSDPVTIGINGINFINGVQWLTGNSATNTALSLAYAISSNTALCPVCVSTYTPPFSLSTTCAGGIITVSTAGSGAIIQLTAISTGTAYIYPIFTSSQTAVTLSGIPSTVSGATFSSISGGSDAAVIRINGRILRNGYDWFAIQNNTQTAASISDAIANSTWVALAGVLKSTWGATGATPYGVVYMTSTINGFNMNFSLFSSSNSAATLSGTSSQTAPMTAFSTMTGGSDAGYSTGTDIIRLPNAGFVNGLAVKFTTGSAATGITGLTSETTYFVILVDTTNIKLAFTSTGAIAGATIDLTSVSTQTVAHLFTLTPVPPSGTEFGWFQVSNDSSTWFNLSVPTISLATPYISTSTYADLGGINGRMIRFVINAAGSGAINTNVTVNGRE